MESAIDMVVGVEGSAFSGKSSAIAEAKKQSEGNVLVVPEACDLVGGNRNFRRIPFENQEQALLNTEFFLAVEKRRCETALEMAVKSGKPVLMDRVTPFSSVMLFALLHEKYPDLHDFGGYYSYALEAYQKALDKGEIFLPGRMIFIQTNEEDFKTRTERGTSVGAFARWETYQYNQEWYRKIAQAAYPGERSLWLESKNGEEALRGLSAAMLAFIMTEKRSESAPDINLKDIFSGETTAEVPQLSPIVIEQEHSHVNGLMERASYEYVKLGEGACARPGSGPEDQAAFKAQMLKTLKEEWGFDYDPVLNYDLDHPDEVYGGKGTWWVIEANGKVVGTMACQDEGDKAYWKRLSIDPEYRKRKWGWEMLLLIARYSKAKGFTTGHFDTIKDTGAYKMYERIGCKIVAEHPEGQYTKIDMEVDLATAKI